MRTSNLLIIYLEDALGTIMGCHLCRCFHMCSLEELIWRWFCPLNLRKSLSYETKSLKVFVIVHTETGSWYDHVFVYKWHLFSLDLPNTN